MHQYELTHQAFQNFIWANRAIIFQAVLFRVRDHHLAEDLTQDIFADAYRQIHRFDPTTGVPGGKRWLFRMVSTKIAHHVRRMNGPGKGNLLRPPPPQDNDQIVTEWVDEYGTFADLLNEWEGIDGELARAYMQSGDLRAAAEKARLPLEKARIRCTRIAKLFVPILKWEPWIELVGTHQTILLNAWNDKEQRYKGEECSVPPRQMKILFNDNSSYTPVIPGVHAEAALAYLSHTQNATTPADTNHFWQSVMSSLAGMHGFLFPRKHDFDFDYSDLIARLHVLARSECVGLDPGTISVQLIKLVLEGISSLYPKTTP